MISQVLQLSSVQSRLVQAAGTGTPSHPVTGWLVGLCDDSQTVVTSVLQRSESRKGNLKADVGTPLYQIQLVHPHAKCNTLDITKQMKLEAYCLPASVSLVLSSALSKTIQLRRRLKPCASNAGRPAQS